MGVLGRELAGLRGCGRDWRQLMLSIGTKDGRIQTRTDTISDSVTGEVNIICINSRMLLKLQIKKKKKTWPVSSSRVVG